MNNDLAQLLVRLWGLEGMLATEGFDAIAIFTGCGEVQRVFGGLQFAKRYAVPNLVILEGNQEEKDRGDAEERDGLVDRYADAFRANHTKVFRSTVAVHTPDQCVSLMDFITQSRWNRVVVTSSNWHLPRVLLTMIKTALTKQDVLSGRSLPRFIPFMAPCPLNRPIPGNSTHGDHDPRDMVREELKKIANYQAKGDIATLPELERYIAHIGA